MKHPESCKLSIASAKAKLSSRGREGEGRPHEHGSERCIC